jgi:hypothetical protein
MIKDQKISDKIPNTLNKLMGRPSKQARIAYNGLVPISPKTTPKAARDKVVSVKNRFLFLLLNSEYPYQFVTYSIAGEFLK